MLPVVPFIILFKMAQTFKSVDQNLRRYHESLFAALYCGAGIFSIFIKKNWECNFWADSVKSTPFTKQGE